MIITLLNSDVKLNKAIHIRQCVLDLSKITIYKLFDQWQQNPHIEDMQLIGGDTDFFFLEVKLKHPRDDILAIMILFRMFLSHL